MMAGGTLAGAGESGGHTLIYLARHGQTPLNESGVLRGECDHLNWPRFGLLSSRILAPPGW